jgi:hypothetical protein
MGTSTKEQAVMGVVFIMFIAGIAAFVIGYFIGLTTKLPERMDIVVGMDNATKGVYERMANYTFKNECCYPSDCAQAKDNPDLCTCTYMVYCGNPYDNFSEQELKNQIMKLKASPAYNTPQ